MILTEFLGRLKGVKRNGHAWVALCPAHDDHKPSLSIREQGGKILLYCHAGCRSAEVLNALGLTMADLFQDSAKVKGEIVATYPYQDEKGALLFEVVRYDPKGFAVRRPNGRGDWIWNMEGVRRVPYNLPEVIKADAVFVCEGEKDCETARALGLVATCTPGGAGKWHLDYSEFLRGKHVAVIADKDEPGRKHAREVACSLFGVAASVRMLELPTGKDLSEWAAPVGTGTLDGLEDLAGATPALTSADIAQSRASRTPGAGFSLTPLAELMREPEETVLWLLDKLLPAGGLSLLAAKPKTGKSTLARCLALAVARGEEFFGRPTVAGPVVYLALEEKRAEVRKHFADLGARGDEPIHIHCAAAPVEAILSLVEVVKQIKPVLVIIDPVLRMVRVRDANDYAQVSAALEPLMSIARQYSTHVLLVYHLGKGERADATDAILGSTAFFAAVDTALVMKRSELHRTLQSRQRYGTDLPETILEFEPVSRKVWLGVEKSEADARRVDQSILEYLERSEGTRTEVEIDDAVKGRNEAKRKELRVLVEEGAVIRSGSGTKGDPFKYAKCSDPCPSHIVGTRVQESDKGTGPRTDTE